MVLLLLLAMGLDPLLLLMVLDPLHPLMVLLIYLYLSDANAANEEADSAAQNDASTFPSSSSSATKYTMNRALSTVQQAWDEYKVGIGGNPSIESLDRTYGKCTDQQI